ncbi:hypothetical protein B0T17DRAFT_646477 [Bombardia bombarda]|uniref:Beta-glucuronidase C-terminal domain-containing protein n=1 Tax=Bombardia bombarda TaxID=252184 RepID=A0AA40BVF6_9PEZI|nr:hypothetical protein B0T17DRAFT_646477 [Bombardia bombarda]
MNRRQAGPSDGDLLGAILATATSATASSAPKPPYYDLKTAPSSPISQPHTPQFVSYSFEPAFWTEFFGEPSSPRNLTFTLLNHLHARGARPIVRTGGITMDSMTYNPNLTLSAVRTENGKGGIYRTTGLAAAAYTHQRGKIAYYELGNEPTNYPTARWQGSTAAYVSQWRNFTSQIDISSTHNASHGKWWASSATTDVTPLKVRPSDLIPAGINSTGQVGQYSIHSYAFATCDPARDRLATTANVLNHTSLLRYADVEIYPSAKAAMDTGAQWVVGEFNSIACSGKPGVSDTFAQALWTADVELIYAVRNASSVHLHQGATLLFQSNQQSNTPGDDGTPGFSSYSLLYPVNSTKRGEARVLPVFVSQLLVVEALAGGGRIAALKTPKGVDEEGFAAYGVFTSTSASGKGKDKGIIVRDEVKKEKRGEALARLVVLNMKPYYADSTVARGTVWLDIGEHRGATVKRMTAPSVDEKDAARVTWAGQSFRDGKAVGDVVVENLGPNERVSVKESEGVLVTFK